MQLAIHKRRRRMGGEGIGAAFIGLGSLDCMPLSLRRDMIFSWLEVDAGSMLQQLGGDFMAESGILLMQILGRGEGVVIDI
jgi:hypothetical protein